jgi:predicted permease
MNAKAELKGALRQMQRQPVFTTVVVLTLALGIGANTAIFSVVDAVLLRSLPVRDAHELVLFRWISAPNPSVSYLTGEWSLDPGTHRVTTSSFSYPAFEAFQREPGALRAVFACADARRLRIAIDGATELASVQLVSGDYYAGLGVSAMRGRAITREDDRVGADAVGVISHSYWQRRWGGDPNVVGRRVTVDGLAVTIVGVAPREFTGTMQLGSAPDLWLPLAARNATLRSDATAYWLEVMGRVSPNASRAAARAGLELVWRQASEGSSLTPANRPRLELTAGGQGLQQRRQGQRLPLMLLAATAGLVQLIACASVAGLLIARGSTRRRELGMRLALGATRRHLIRQLLVESLTLAVLGAGLGLGVGHWTSATLAAGLLPDGTVPLHLDGRMLAFTAALALVTALAFGLLPALRATRGDVVGHFNEDAPAGRRRARLAPRLVVAQIALSLMLVVAAGLLLRTVRSLTHADTGFDAASVHLFSIEAPFDGGDRMRQLDLTRRVLDRVAGWPEVRAAGVSLHYLIEDKGEKQRVSIDGEAATNDRAVADVNWVGGDFFAALGIPVRSGRALGRHDDAQAARVAVINEAFARRYFGARDAIGHHVNGREIVGVVGDTKYGSLRSAAPPMLFVPLFQEPMDHAVFSVRVQPDLPRALLAARVRDLVREMAPTAALNGPTTAEAQVAKATTEERLLATLTGFFGGLALLLASLGLYGLLAYRTTRRTREIGVRRAVGATTGDIVWLALGDGLRLAAAGALLGLAGALATSRLLSGLLYDVAPTDPATFLVSVAVLWLVALLACAIPALRAARVHPMAALRRE